MSIAKVTTEETRRGPDPNCPNCDGYGSHGFYPNGPCGVCWTWDPKKYPDREDIEREQVKGLLEERAQGILAKDDPAAAAFNAGYDDYPIGSNPFESDTRFWRFYNHGWEIARQYAEQEAAARAGGGAAEMMKDE